MKFSTASLFALALAAGQTAFANSEGHNHITASPTGATQACERLKQQRPDLTSFPGTDVFATRNTQYWSAANILTPTCIFTPQTTDEHASFAVRDGGHMPIPHFSGTDSGVLISLSSMTGLALSTDKSTVTVGPGNRWGDVYNYLEPHNLVCVGGRVSSVGVPGLLLGGGISFLSAEHGFASDNVVEWEVVLANATVVTASETEHPDLYWSLKGGGNSFGVVTRFVLKTYPSGEIWAGILQYPGTAKEAWIDAVTEFAGQTDVKAAIIPSYVLVPDHGLEFYISTLFYNGDVAEPEPLKQFLELPLLQPSGWGRKTFAECVRETVSWAPGGSREVFYIICSFVDREAVVVTLDIFGEGVKGLNVAGLVASLSFQPVSKSFIEQGYLKGGNPQRIDPEKAPYLLPIITLSWSTATDDTVVYSFVKEIAEKINRELEARKLKAEFLYLNDADVGQKVFESYGEGSLERLRSVRRSVDPRGVFMELENGGWKVGW